MRIARSAGLLLPVFSLPGEHGIGTLGKEAYAWIDFLAEAKQTYWQLLPVGPTGYGNSPYQSFSTFAGNPYFIDPDLLAEDGLLSSDEYRGLFSDIPRDRVDYGALFLRKEPLLRKAVKRLFEAPPAGLNQFFADASGWLEDYALFTALKRENRGAPFWEWRAGEREGNAAALEEARRRLSEEIRYEKGVQYLFFTQWVRLKVYAARRGVRLFGDLPFYVSADSAEVFFRRDEFFLDARGAPSLVAGCPPDAFSAGGQLWGNPVYRFDVMRERGYRFWLERLSFALGMFDLLRIDHFRGFDAFYTVGAGAEDAREGTWQRGPGAELFRTAREALGDLPLVAEDLGFVTDSVRELLRAVDIPGMKVLQFAFDSREAGDYLPYRYPMQSVVYTGTHDNDTLRGFCRHAAPRDIERAMRYLLAENEETLCRNMMLAALSSVSDLAILTVQDLLGLGSEGRINTPGTQSGNWEFRLPRPLGEGEARFLAEYTELYGRAPATSA